MRERLRQREVEAASVFLDRQGMWFKRAEHP